MSGPRLSLIVGGGAQAPESGGITLPLPETGIVHVHLHIGEPAVPAPNGTKKQAGHWPFLVTGVVLVAALTGGYQLGRRSTPNDVSSLRPGPAFSAPAARDLPLPEPTIGLPAIQRQLATPPEIIPPARAPQQPGTAARVPSTPSPGAPAPGRNAFGLEN